MDSLPIKGVEAVDIPKIRGEMHIQNGLSSPASPGVQGQKGMHLFVYTCWGNCGENGRNLNRNPCIFGTGGAGLSQLPSYLLQR